MTVTRQDLADALDSVGVEGHALPPDVAAAGAGWPVWKSSTYLAQGLETSWDVFVVLPGGPSSAAIVEADPLVLAVADALNGLGAVQLIEPVSLTSDAQGTAQVPALRLSLTTI